ncbi:MAG: hypothetical protein MJ007_02835 [Paludibacteraceae bacterium]|nr:hypothetical protein [Paludibacteraceae bacterium]
MAEQIKFTQLPNVGDLTASAIIALAQAQGGDYASYSASLAQIAELLNKGISYEELPTEAKDILGAITEIYNSGGGGGGSNVKMKDNPNGGVDLTVDGLLRTLALQGSGGGGESVHYQISQEASGQAIWTTNSTEYVTIASFGVVNLPKGLYYLTTNTLNFSVSTPSYQFVVAIRYGDTYIEVIDVGDPKSATINGVFEIEETGEYLLEICGKVKGSSKTVTINSGQNFTCDVFSLGSGGGSSVIMSDNATGGVDLTVEGEARTLATQKDLDTLYKITQGQSWDFVDRQESGTNVAPKGTERQSLISVEGKSEQETTNGYQLSPLYTLTASATGNINFDSGTIGKVEAGNDYVLSFINNTPVNANVALRIFDGTAQQSVKAFPLIPNGKTTVTFNAVATGDVMLNRSMGAEYANQDVFTEIMLEKGSTAHDFEPYTGGLPAPSPAYPQPITSVEQLNFKVTGRNLYNKDAYPLTFNYAITKSGGSVYATTSGNYYATRDFIPISGVHGKTLSGTPKMTVCFYDKDKVYISGAITGETGATSFVVPDNAEFIRFDTHKDYYEVVMIKLGTTPTAYEPYREETHTITPPFALNKIGDFADFASIEAGEWVKKINKFTYTATSVTAWSNIFDIRPAISGLARPFLMSDKFIGSDAEYNSNSEANAGMSSGTISPRFPTTDRLYYKGTATREELLEALTNATIYGVVDPIIEPIEATDLEYLKSLQNLDSDNVITITDQNNNDISYLMKYLIKLSEAI